MELIDTECIFHTPPPGAAPLPLSDYAYARTSRDRSRFMPHIVVGDPSRREPLIDHAKVPPEITEDYLGVAFWDGDSPLVPDRSLRITMALMYFPHVNYAAVVQGATFTIRVGPRIIGFGRVLQRYSSAEAPSGITG